MTDQSETITEHLPTDPSPTRHPLSMLNPAHLLLAVLLLLLFVVILRRAWMSDDAFITMRTVDNFVNGYGLRWNVSERVQSFTHPLWMFVLTAAYSITREPFITVIVVGLVCSMAAVLLFTRVGRTAQGVALGLVALTFSNAFVDYTTSGLENPLTFLLLVIFALLFFERDITPRRFLLLSLVSSLIALNRQDTGLLVLPALIYAFFRLENKISGVLLGIIGQLPLVLWEIFSLLYYGFPFPNTFYAKLNTGIPVDQLATQGWLYLLYSLETDPVTLVVIAMSAVGVIYSGHRARRFAFLLGIILYLLYIIRIGGDFMAGRFLAAPLLCAVILLARVDFSRLSRGVGWALLVVPVSLGLIAAPPTYSLAVPENLSIEDIKNGIANERLFYFNETGLFNQQRNSEAPYFRWRYQGDQLRQRAADGFIVLPVDTVGLRGFYAGPNVHIIDSLALNDPLLARLPAFYRPDWRIGHFDRVIPPGYQATLETGRNLIQDPNLAAYYDRLELIVRGDLLSGERLGAIIAMNLGRNDDLVDEFAYRFPDAITVDGGLLTSEQVGDNLPDRNEVCAANGGVTLPPQGALFNFSEPSTAQTVTLNLDRDDAYMLSYRLAGQQVAEQIIARLDNRGDQIEFAQQRVSVPAAALTAGYDQVHVLPLRGGLPYCVNSIVFASYNDTFATIFDSLDLNGEPKIILEGSPTWQSAVVTYVNDTLAREDVAFFHLTTPEDRASLRRQLDGPSQIAVATEGSAERRLLEFAGDSAQVWYIAEQRQLVNQPLLTRLEEEYAPLYQGRTDAGTLVRDYRRSDSQARIFGEQVELAAWALPDGTTVTACESLPVDSLWQTALPITLEETYRLRYGLLEQGQPDETARALDPDAVLQLDTWSPGTYVRDSRAVEIPCNTPPGAYQLIVTLTHTETGDFAAVAAPSTPDAEPALFAALATLEVAAP